MQSSAGDVRLSVVTLQRAPIGRLLVDLVMTSTMLLQGIPFGAHSVPTQVAEFDVKKSSSMNDSNRIVPSFENQMNVVWRTSLCGRAGLLR